MLVIRSALLSLALAGTALADVPAPLETARVRAYQIAPGPLGATLSSFAMEAGIALSFLPALTEGLTSPGLSGNYSPRQAMSRLLAGSGLEAVLRNDGSYTLVLRQVTLSDTTVSGVEPRTNSLPPLYSGNQVATGGRLGMLGNTDIMDAPFSVSTYSAALIKDQQATTVGDVLERDSSVRSTGQTGGIVDSFFIRGFPVGEGNLGELAFDGVYGVASNYRVFTDYAERIEVVKGPGALLYGMAPNSAVGGVINIVPKRSLDEDLTRYTASYAQDAHWGNHLDISRRLGEARRLGVRINASVQNGDTVIDQQSRNIDIGALSLDYQGERLRTSLDLISQQETFDAASRPFLIDSGVAIPTAANGRTNVSQDWGWSRTRDKSALLSGEYDLTDALTVFAHAGGGKSAVARLSDQTPSIVNAAGDTSSIPGYYRFNVQRYTVDVGAWLRFDTGPISHRSTLQASRYRDELSRGIISGAPVLSNIYHPVNRPEPSIAKPDMPKVSASELSGVAIADTLSILDQRAQITLGLRQQRIQSSNYNNAGAVTSAYDDSQITPLFGVVLKPWEHVAFYYNALEGLSKGDVAPSNAANAGRSLCALRVQTTRSRGQDRLRHVHVDPRTVPDPQAQRRIGRRALFGTGPTAQPRPRTERVWRSHPRHAPARRRDPAGRATDQDRECRQPRQRTGGCAQGASQPVGRMGHAMGRGPDAHQRRALYRPPVRQPGQHATARCLDTLRYRRALQHPHRRTANHISRHGTEPVRSPVLVRRCLIRRVFPRLATHVVVVGYG